MEKVFDVPKRGGRSPGGGGRRGGEVAEINLFHKQFFRDWSGTIRKSRANFFPPPNFFLPVRPCTCKY
jgi:hypothetical protein